MADMGLAGMAGAGGAGDAMQTLFDQRMKAAQLQQQGDLMKRQLDQQDALTRLKFAEQAEATRARVEVSKQVAADRAEAAKQLDEVRKNTELSLIPTDTPLSGDQMGHFTGAGVSSARFAPTPIASPAPPSSIAAPGDSGQPTPMPGTIANSPSPAMETFHRIPTAPELQHQQDEAAKLAAIRNPVADHAANRAFDVAHPLPLRTDPTAHNDTRLDNSYNRQTTRLDAIEKPLADQAERIGRLRQVVNQMTPQADTLIAPELLTITAGGMGSGLRMSEAEIARVVGGRNQWQDIQARLNAWQQDPTKPFAVTPVQRKQIRDLVKAIADRGQKRLSMIDNARDSLTDAADVQEHRRIVDALKKALTTEALGSDDAAVAGTAPKRIVYDLSGKPIE